MTGAGFIDGLVERIYEAPFMPHLWQGILDDLARIADARGGVMATYGLAPTVFLRSDGIAAFIDDVMADPAFRMHQLNQHLIRLPSWEFHCDTRAIPPEERMHLEVYDRLFKPHRIGSAVANTVNTSFGDTMIFSLPRDAAKGPVSDDELARLNEVRPHLARAVALATRNEFQQIRNTNQALAAAGLATAAINARGRIIDCNDLFVSMGSQVRIRPNNEFRLNHEPADAIVRDLIDRAATGDRTATRLARSLALPATDHSQAAILHVIPSGNLIRDLFTGTVLFIIIAPLGSGRATSSDIIESLYDLTVAEARIAQALAEGADVKDIADSFGITADTVRRHLKNIYAKTGFSRQAELSATIASLPRFS